MHSAIKEILDYAICAPSGENCQPWVFEVKGNIIYLYNTPESDQSLYNLLQFGSYVSHGAVIENIVVAAQTLGFSALVTLFPSSSNANLVAEIRLEQAAPQAHALMPFIKTRVSNRKSYSTESISAGQIQALGATASADAAVRLISDREKIIAVARAISQHERVLFENKSLHNFFFSHIRWNEAENAQDPTGFFIKTLELSPQETKGFSLIRHWNAVRVFNLLGFSKKAASENEKKYAASGAMAVIVIKEPTKEHFVEVGRVTERLWLTATQLGLSMQPMSGLLFLRLGIKRQELSGLPLPQQELIKNAYTTIANVFGVDSNSQTLAMIFRIGKADPPTARAARSTVRLVS